MAIQIMIIDDEPKMGSVLKRALSREGWEVTNYDDPEIAVSAFEQAPCDIVLSDLKMPKLSGLEVLERVKAISPKTEFVMMTAYASAQTAVDAMKNNAYDYLIKPFSMDELKILIRRIIETRNLREETNTLRAENEQLRELVNEKFKVENFISVSPRMEEVLERVRKVSRKTATVLLRGESGTGKEVIAAAIHLNSPRKDKPFLKINCGALPENLLESELFGHIKGSFTGADSDRSGLFESANGGTIFLDEIGEVTPSLQVKLLRVLQEGEIQRVGESTTRKVDVRMVAATHRNLEAMIESSEFRLDLFYRLNVVPIVIPTLRERKEDILSLVDHFIQKAAKNGHEVPKNIQAEALDALLTYDWPGNIRELENAVEHALVMCEKDELQLDDLPLSMKTVTGDASNSNVPLVFEHLTLDEIEQRAIKNALKRANFNYTKTSKLLGVTRRTLGYRMQKYRIPGKNGVFEEMEPGDEE